MDIPKIIKVKMSDIGDNVQDLGDITEPHMAVHMSGNDYLYGSDSEEVIIKKMDIQKDMITSSNRWLGGEVQ